MPDAPLTAETIYREHLEMIVYFLGRFRIPDQDLADVTQEVFVAIQTGLPRFDPSRPVRAWLYGIICRQAQSHHRERVRLRERLGEVPEEVDSSADPAEQMTEKETRDDVRRALDAIELDRSAVLMAVEMLEMTAEETAHALGIPVNTAKSRLRLARDDFRRVWARIQLAHGRPRAARLPLGAAVLMPMREFPPVPDEIREALLARLPGWVLDHPTPGPVAFSRRWPRLAAFVGKGLRDLTAGGAGGAVVFALLSPSPKTGYAPSRNVVAAVHSAPLQFMAATSTTAALAAVPVARPAAASRRPSAPESGTTSALAAERSMLGAAEGALDNNDLPLARRSLDLHTRRFPRGKLVPTRQALVDRLASMEREDHADRGR